MNYLLDTDVVIDFLNQKGKGFDFIQSHIGKNKLYISVITSMELRAGWTDDVADTYVRKLHKLFSATSAVESIALRAGGFIKRYSQKGITLSFTDTLIAATAIEHDFCLVTRNKKDFPMPEVKLYNWES